MRIGLAFAAIFALTIFTIAGTVRPSVEPQSSYNGLGNGLVAQATHAGDRAKFEQRETVATGLGPMFNGQSCAECHQSPVTGGNSNKSVLRVGHIDPATHAFVEPPGGSLMHEHAIDPAIDVRVPYSENIRSRRMALSLLGDGYVEAIDDATIIAIAKSQRKATGGRIAGQVAYAPVLEAAGATRVGRFGWKAQHASLLSFSADSYFNEEGITNRFFPTENTALGKSVAEYDTVPDPEDERRGYHQGIASNDHNYVSYVDVFTRFIRATKAPPRDSRLAATADAQAGSRTFEKIGCSICHVSTLRTAAPGTMINGGQFQVPEALGDKVIHPYSDFLHQARACTQSPKRSGADLVRR
ncbi:MAG: di-heme oxidoredictase family protein [Terriglobales bacterium]